MVRLGGMLLVAVLGVVASAAAFADPPELAADSTQTGYIQLLGFGAPGTRVEAGERVGRRYVALASGAVGDDGVFYAPKATTWRCDRVLRKFESRTIDPSGHKARQRFSLRTPSCRQRLALRAPRRVTPGGLFRIRVADRWGLGGVHARLCVSARCSPLVIPRSTRSVLQPLSLRRRGITHVSVRLAGFVTSALVGVGVTAPRRLPRSVVLATGDSTMQGVESFLADRLPARVEVAREYFVGTGITRPITPWWPYWPTLAQRLAHERNPRLTVISLGANDGYPLTPPGGDAVECCTPTWIDEYARRQREIMAAFSRGGAGRVLWLTLPAPRDAQRRRYSAAVNAATLAAARGNRQVRVVRLDRIFTPDFRYRSTMRDHGRRVRVRLPDGIHLSARGTDIAARAVAAAVRGWPGTV